MAGRIWIGPYKPLGVSTQAVPGGGYLSVDARAGQFGPSPLLQLGLQAAEGAAGIATVVSEQPGRDNEAVVKTADTRLGETEQALLFDPQNGYLNLQGQAALTQAPAVLEAYANAQDRELAGMADDDQRGMLQGLIERRLASFTTQVERHASAERQRWYDQAGEQRIAHMQADAGFYWSDDALLRRALGTTRAEVREKAARHGWDSPLIDAALRQQTSRTLVAAIEAAVDRDPGRAQALRTRYATVIEDPDSAALDALLSEAQTRQRMEAASRDILNATPPDGEQPTPQWRLRQAEAITDPGVRAATVRRLQSAADDDEGRARTLGEQVLARVLKDGLTDPSRIPVREWGPLDSERRQAIETRLDHNAAGTEPPPNPALVEELATQMTQAPSAFARRDLIPAIAHLPLPQWQRFRDWQAGIRRDDPATEDQLYAIKRGLQIATKTLPADTSDDVATNYRAELVEEIDTWRRINGKSPDDADIAGMLERRFPIESYPARTLEWDPRERQRGYQTISGDTNRMGARLGPMVRRLTRGATAAGRLLWGSEREIAEVAAALGYTAVQRLPSRISNKGGQTFFFNPETEQYITASPYGLGFWLLFDALGRLMGVYSEDLTFFIPRDRLPPDLEKEWTKPETFPADDPLPPLPPTPFPEPQRPEIEVYPAPPPALPDIEVFPIPPPAKPLIIESQGKPTDNEEPHQQHHKIPQELWKLGRKRRLLFSPAARRVFNGLTVEVPKGKHWGGLHAAYNREVRKALKAHLDQKAQEHNTTPEGYAANMSEDQAIECYKKVTDAIRNSKEDTDDANAAREFLDRTDRYEQKKASKVVLQ